MEPPENHFGYIFMPFQVPVEFLIPKNVQLDP